MKITPKNVDEWDGKAPLPMLYAKASTGAVTTWLCWVERSAVFVQWGQLGGTQQTASFECAPKNTGKANATTAAEQARLEAIAKFRKSLKKKYYMTEKEARTELNLKPMLAKSFPKAWGKSFFEMDDKNQAKVRRAANKILYPVSVQPKFDGVRCLAYLKDGKPYLQSRGGDPYNVPHIMSAYEGRLQEGVVMDGELYVHGMSRQNIIRLVKKNRPESMQLEHRLYDRFIIGTDQWWEHRGAYLRDWYAHNQAASDKLVLCESYIANDAGYIRQLHDEFVKKGYEGAIIRLLKGVYKIAHRSSDLLKLKDFDDSEFEVLGYRVGKGKFAGVPMFMCAAPNGKTFEVAPKGTAEERLEMLKDAAAAKYTGEILTVRHFGYSDDGIPTFPVGVGFRSMEDMSEAETEDEDDAEED